MMKSGDYSERHLENVNHRLDRVEQILPTLATKVDLERFATKKDMEAIRDETSGAIQEAVGQIRVLFEAQTHEIRLIAEAFTAHVGRHAVLERRVDDHDAALSGLDLRVRRIDALAGRRRR